MLFPALHLTALTTSEPGCMPCLISMPTVLPRMTSILGILRQCNTASPPAMMSQSRSPTGAYRQDLVMPTHSPGSSSPWMHWWGPSTSPPWTSPVGTTRSPWIPGTSTRQRSRHPSACMNTQGCRWAWRQPLPPSSV